MHKMRVADALKRGTQLARDLLRLFECYAGAKCQPDEAILQCRDTGSVLLNHDPRCAVAELFQGEGTARVVGFSLGAHLFFFPVCTNKRSTLRSILLSISGFSALLSILSTPPKSSISFADLRLFELFEALGGEGDSRFSKRRKTSA